MNKLYGWMDVRIDAGLTEYFLVFFHLYGKLIWRFRLN